MEKNIFDGVKAAYKGLDDKLAIDIKVLDISEISPIADYFLIASGSANTATVAGTSIFDELESIVDPIHVKNSIR